MLNMRFNYWAFVLILTGSHLSWGGNETPEAKAAQSEASPPSSGKLRRLLHEARTLQTEAARVAFMEASREIGYPDWKAAAAVGWAGYFETANLSAPEAFTVILLAAKCSHKAVLDTLVRRGWNLNMNGPGAGIESHTPLALAAYRGDTVAIRSLVEAGADPNGFTPSSSTTTPLLMAIEGGQAVAVKELVRLGANPGLAVAPRVPPIGLAAYKGKLPCIMALVELGVDPCANLVVSGHVVTPIFLAAGTNQVQAVELLIGLEADFEGMIASVTDPNMQRALYAWSEVSVADPSVLPSLFEGLLLSVFVDTDFDLMLMNTHDTLVLAQALKVAILKNKLDYARAIGERLKSLNAHANLMLQDLIIAPRILRRPQAVALILNLLQYDPQDATIPNTLAYALRLAVQHSEVESAEQLLNAGVSPRLVLESKVTKNFHAEIRRRVALALSVFNLDKDSRFAELTEDLKPLIANFVVTRTPEDKDVDWSARLVAGVKNGNVGEAKRALQNQADPNACDGLRRPVLFLALNIYDTDTAVAMTKLLLVNGASLNPIIDDDYRLFEYLLGLPPFELGEIAAQTAVLLEHAMVAGIRVPSALRLPLAAIWQNNSHKAAAAHWGALAGLL